MRTMQLTVLLMAAALTLTASAAQQDTQKDPGAEAQLQAAITKETVEGNLKDAIEQYKTLAQDNDKSVAARALVRLGGCYEKQGNAEARKTYEQVLNNFGDQRDAVAAARKRLAVLAQRTGSRSGLSTRRVWTPGRMNLGGPSPDGRFQAHMEDRSGNLVLRDLQTGETRLLTNEETSKGGYVEVAVVSPDSKQVAFTWGTGERSDYLHLRIVNIDGSNQRTIFRCGEGAAWVIPIEWTPDGKQILVTYNRAGSNATYHVGLISATTGTLRPVVEMPWGLARFASISPDGYYVAYNKQTQEDALENDVYVVSLRDAHETRVVLHPADDNMPVWTPDGRGILFASDRRGTYDLWLQPVADGNPSGEPSLVKPDLGDAELLGITGRGSLYYRVGAGTMNIITAEIDETSGKLRAEPRRIVEKYTGNKMHPTWSWNGQWLAYFRAQLGSLSRATSIVIQPVNGGPGHEIPTNLSFPLGLDWFPDGRSLLVLARDYRDRQGLWRVDAATGESRPLPEVEGETQEWVKWVGRPSLSNDGKTVYLGRGALDVDSGKINSILEEGPVTAVSPSPDNSRVAFVLFDNLESVGRGPGTKYKLAVVPSSGGEPRPLADVNGRGALLGWSTDNRYIYFVGSGKQGTRELLRISAEGGDAESIGLTLPAGQRTPIRNGRVAYLEGAVTSEVWVLENFLPATQSEK